MCMRVSHLHQIIGYCTDNFFKKVGIQDITLSNDYDVYDLGDNIKTIIDGVVDVVGR